MTSADSTPRGFIMVRQALSGTSESAMALPRVLVIASPPSRPLTMQSC
jgi:hypothetical protein